MSRLSDTRLRELKDKMLQRETILEIRCVYCDCFMGTKDGQGIEGITTSICPNCWKQHYPQWEYPKETK